jgi:phosphoribosyl-ATP pyrophosphohydrolase
MNISEQAIEKIKKLNDISFKLNGGRKETVSYTLESIKEHAEEISQLFSANNEHWAIETGDLMIHCMKMLLMNGFDLNEMFDKCRDRFESKITKLLKIKKY